MATVYTSCCSNHYYDPKIRDNKGQGRDIHFKRLPVGSHDLKIQLLQLVLPVHFNVRQKISVAHNLFRTNIGFDM